ncbi:MAG: hypothetical protein LH649_13785, partial [Pseudanabaena sp. CAN_BIN31]|nr:hypothetical protein [Pseudanabaena sp. CAN_BIN31]
SNLSLGREYVDISRGEAFPPILINSKMFLFGNASPKPRNAETIYRLRRRGFSICGARFR